MRKRDTGMAAWLALHIDTVPIGLEPVELMLSNLGIDSFMVEDEGEFRDFLEQNQQYWDYVDESLDKAMTGKCRVTFYVENDGKGLNTMAAVRIALAALKRDHPEYAPLIMTVDGLEEADWANNWRAYYKPMEIGERLLVLPDWEQADPKGRVVLSLDPGLAFGTGSHATTRMCLTALEKAVAPGMRVLDLGCGSGILSIAALLLGAGSAAACDIDDKAADIAYQNAAHNGVGRDRYTVLAGDVLTDEKLLEKLGGGYDIVLANIVSDVILALAPRVRQFLRPGGLFICSGIIDTRGDELRAALQSAGLTILEENSSEGWYSFTCRPCS